MEESDEVVFELVDSRSLSQEEDGDRESLSQEGVDLIGAIAAEIFRPRISPLEGDVSAQGGIVNIGIGLFNNYKILRANGTIHVIGRGNSEACSDAKGENNKIANAWEGVSKAFQDLRTILDNQSLFAALFCENESKVYGRLDNLQLQEERSFASIIDSIQSEEAKNLAREYKTNVDVAMEAYAVIVEDLKLFEENDAELYPEYVKDDAKEAKLSATRLYIWAKTFVPDYTTRNIIIDKKTKIKKLPYILAMALAVRIEMDACVLEAEMMKSESDRHSFLQRSQKKAMDFVELLQGTLLELLTSTALVEIALELHTHISTYISLIASFRFDFERLITLRKFPMPSYKWNDELAILRELLYETSDSEDQTNDCVAELSNLEESLWWIKFTGTDTRTIKHISLSSSVHVRSLCEALGADDTSSKNFRFNSGKKEKMLQLPSVFALRNNFMSRLQSALSDCGFRNLKLKDKRVACIRKLEHLEYLVQKSIKSRLVFGDGFERIKCVTVTPDGQNVISGGHDNAISVWCMRTGKKRMILGGHDDAVDSVAVTPDGMSVVSGSKDKSIRVWCLQSGQVKWVFSGHNGWVRMVVVTPDGKNVVSSSQDTSIKVWSLITGKIQRTLEGHTKYVKSIALTPDGKEIVSGSGDSTVKVWDLKTGNMRKSLSMEAPVCTIAMHPDGKRVIAGLRNGKIATAWLRDGKIDTAFDGNIAIINSIAITAEGARIVACGQKKEIRIWNLRSCEEEGFICGHLNEVHGVVISPDREIVSCGADSTIRVWK